MSLLEDVLKKNLSGSKAEEAYGYRAKVAAKTAKPTYTTTHSEPERKAVASKPVKTNSPTAKVGTGGAKPFVASAKNDLKFAKVNEVVYKKRVEDLSQSLKNSQVRHEMFFKKGDWGRVKKERETMAALDADLKKYKSLIAENSKVLSIPTATSYSRNGFTSGMPDMDTTPHQYSTGTGVVDKIGNFAKRVDNGLWGIHEGLGASLELAEDTLKQSNKANSFNGLLKDQLENQKNAASQIDYLKNYAHKGDTAALEADPEYLQAVKKLQSNSRVINAVRNAPMDTNTQAFKDYAKASAYKEKAVEGLSSVGKFVGDTAMSIGDTIAAMPTAVINPNMPLAILGAKSGAGKIYDVSNNGGTASEALARGIVSGGIEAATEKIGLDNLMKSGMGGAVKQSGAEILKGLLKNTSKQSAIEGAEEGLSYIGNYGADKAFGDQNAKFDVKELGLSALGGALSGAVMGGGSALIGNGATNGRVAERKGLNDPLLNGLQLSEREETSDPIFSIFNNSRNINGKVENIYNQGIKIEPARTDAQSATGPVNAIGSISTSTNTSINNSMQKSNNYSPEQELFNNNGKSTVGSAEVSPNTISEERISKKDNSNQSAVRWHMVDYSNNKAKNEIVEKKHSKMLDEGKVIKITNEDLAKYDEYYPDLRSMKKKERVPIIKEKISAVKNILRTYLNDNFKGKPIEFNVNGNVIEAKLYDVGIREVLDRLTKEKSAMIRKTGQIFSNSEYLYSTNDKSNSKEIEKWNYFYVPIEIDGENAGVRIAVRDIKSSGESQIYNWNIKKEATVPSWPYGDNPAAAYGHSVASSPGGQSAAYYSAGNQSDGTSTNTSINNSMQKSNNYSENEAENGSFGKNTVGSAQANPNSSQALADRFGYISEGENPKVRQAIVPLAIDDSGKKTSRHVRTAIEAPATTNEVVSKLEEDILNGRYAYEPISDKKANSSALSTLENKGYDNARNLWRASVESDRIPTKKEIALGERLYIEACAAGDIKTASRLIAEISAAGTRAGQTVQAMRLLKRLSPEGQLYYLQKTVENINKDGNHKNTVEIKEDLADRLIKAKTAEDVNLAIENIKQDVASQLPASWMDKWNAWRYMSMLANPRTHVRNILGNMIFQPAIGLKNTIGMVMENTYNKTTGLENKTKAILTPKDKGAIDFAKHDYDVEMKDVLSSTGKMNTQSEIESMKRIFDLKALEWARKTNFGALEKEDNAFLRISYSRSLAQYMKANGYSLEFIKSTEGGGALESARRYATNEALRATYRDENKIVNALNRFRNTNTASSLFMDAVLPFRKTPANILSRGIDYSPIGFLKGTKQLLMDVKANDKTANEAIDLMASGLSGTGIVALGVFLASKGLLKGGLGDDKEDKLKQATGEQEYALEIDNKSYTIDWMAPLAMPLFVGAELYGLTQKDTDTSAWEVVEALSKITGPMFNLSMLDGVNSVISAGRYGENPTYDILTTMPKNYLSQGVPTVLGQVARTVDDTRRTTYVDKNKDTPTVVQQFSQGVEGKVPIYNQKLEPKLDLWGREEKNSSVVGRALQNFISPGYASVIEETAADKEVKRLYAVTGENSVIPSKPPKYFSVDGERYDLNAKEYTQLVKTANQKALSDIKELTETKNYKDLSNEDKAGVIQRVFEYDRAIAKKAVNSQYKLQSSHENISENSKKMGISTAKYILIQQGFEDINSDKDKEGGIIKAGDKDEKKGEGKSASLKKKEIIDSIPNLTASQRQVLYEANDVSQKLWKSSK